MSYRRIINLKLLLRNWKLASSTFFPITQTANNVKFSFFTFGAFGIGSTAFLFQQAGCLSNDDAERQTVPRRLQRFMSFASVEYEGCVYMTPQDLLDSLILDQPRERVFRNVLHKQQVERFLRVTSTLKGPDKMFFRRHAHDGIISYSEYLFLLTLLTSKENFETR